jgi:RimJ/RimL family protein N-acetyltransferase
MQQIQLSVREIQKQDIELISQYWQNADESFLKGMGADKNKLPSNEEFTQMLTNQVNAPLEEKKSYCIIWEVDGKAVGHSNVNKIVFGEEAFMHLHLWNAEIRKKGFGPDLVKMTLPYFFENLKLKKLFCEPYALNPAPNKTMEKIGFAFVKSYITIPGYINFEQEVNLWEMDLARFKELSAQSKPKHQ